MSEEMKSPLGLCPEDIWQARMNSMRIAEILSTIDRYVQAGVLVPKEWVEELARRVTT